MRAIIIGAGKMAQIHARSLQNNNKIKSFSVCGRNTEHQNLFSKFAKFFKYESNLDNMLNIEVFSYAIICLPHALRKDQFISLLQHGCHILTEKPSFTNLHDANEIFDLSLKLKKKIIIGYTLRYLPEIRQLRNLIEDNQLGVIKEIFIRMGRWAGPKGWLNNPELSTGVVGELSVHAIDLCRFLHDKIIIGESHALRKLQQGRKTPDSLSLTLDYEDGSFANINTSLNMPISENEIIVVGENAVSTLNNFRVITRSLNRDYSFKNLFVGDYLNGLGIPLRYLFYNPYQVEMDEFIDHRYQNTDYSCDLRFDLETVKLCEDIIKIG